MSIITQSGRFLLISKNVSLSSDASAMLKKEASILIFVSSASAVRSFSQKL
jgi:hypothetical protein